MKTIVGKIIIFAQLLFFIALGLLGLLIPVLPGLVFLMIAALIAARYFPALETWLHKNRYSAECMHISNRFSDLHIRDKARLCFWGTLKVTLNGIEWTWQLFERQLKKLVQI